MEQTQPYRLWVLSELYYPEDSATGYYITQIAESMAGFCQVEVLSAQPTYRARGTRAPADEVLKNVHIHRCAATTLNKDILVFRLLNLFTISVSLFFNAVWKIRRSDIVLVVTNPPTLPFVALLATKLRGAKLILRIEDIYPDAMVAAGMVKPTSLLVRFLNVVHRSLYRNADRVVALGRDMLRLIHRKLGAEAGHVSTITNWADSDLIAPLDRSTNPLLRKLGLGEKFVIQYSGNMGRTHDIEVLVRCAGILKDDRMFHFLFVGAGAKEQWLRKTTRDLKLGNVTILPPQPRSELAQLLNACDLAVISFVAGMSGVSVPSRMYNNFAAGKPILAIADADSELAQVIQEARVGWVVRPGSEERAVHAIREAASNRALLLEMSGRASALAIHEHTRRHVMEQYEQLVRSVASSATSSRQGAS
jgi:glycosyltransferase involved in cell wall biosynthesis